MYISYIHVYGHGTKIIIWKIKQIWMKLENGFLI